MRWRKFKRMLSTWLREAVLVLSGAAGPLRCNERTNAMNGHKR